MGKNPAKTLIDELYSTIEHQILQNQSTYHQTYLNQLNDVEEKFISSYTKKKREGGYYTAKILTDFIFSEALVLLINKRQNLPSITNFKDLDCLSSENRQKIRSFLLDITICDPSCGSGAFLVNAVEIVKDLLNKLEEEKVEFKIIYKILENIKGYDLNECAIKLCRLKLYKWFYAQNKENANLKLAFEIIKNNIIIKDTLTQPISLKFDVLIGNPPYGNILDQYQRDSLKKKGIFHKEIYCAFLLNALEWSNGIIGLLVPKSFLLRQSYIDFRKNLLEKANLLKIYDIGPNIFKRATNEVQILLYEKKHSDNKNLEIYNNAKEKILTYSNQNFDALKYCNNEECPFIDKSKKVYVYSLNEHCPYCNFKTKYLNRIRIKPNSKLLNIINKIENNGNLNYLNIHDFPKLIRGEEDRGLRAVRAILGNHLHGSCIFLNAKNDFLCYHYHKNKSFDIENINPKKLKGNNYDYYLNPKLLIKHNNTYPVALYTEESVCFTSSIYSLLHDDKIELKFLCALLNSYLLKFYCIYGINNQINTTINLNQYMIRHIPIPKASDKVKHDLATRVDSIITLYNNLQPDKLKISELQQGVEKIIFQLFSLKTEEKAAIFKSIQA